MIHPVLTRWDLRLTNWALWRAGSDAGGGGYACDGEHGEGAPRPPPPLVGEALDTDMLVQRLSLEHHRAVVAVYVITGSSEDRALWLGISQDGMVDRCNAAMFRLEDMDRQRRPTHTHTHVPETCAINR